VLTIYATQNWIGKNGSYANAENLELVTEDELEKISSLQAPKEVVAILKQLPQVIPILAQTDFCLYLDTIQDPGNFGTIIRIADWFGIKYIVCTPGCADAYNSKVIQSSMASIGRVQIYYDEDGKWLQHQKTKIVAATLQGTSVYNYNKMSSGVLVIGNESKGIRPELISLATEAITIPGRGGAESLNAAVATGIILSHLLN
jgi:TrmH family RNA methyltransferase